MGRPYHDWMGRLSSAHPICAMRTSRGTAARCTLALECFTCKHARILRPYHANNALRPQSEDVILHKSFYYENRFANLIIIIRPASQAFLSVVPYGTSDKIYYENRFANLIIIIRPASQAFLSVVPYGTSDKIYYENRFANLIIIIRPASQAFLSVVPYGTSDKIYFGSVTDQMTSSAGSAFPS